MKTSWALECSKQQMSISYSYILSYFLFLSHSFPTFFSLLSRAPFSLPSRCFLAAFSLLSHSFLTSVLTPFCTYSHPILQRYILFFIFCILNHPSLFLSLPTISVLRSFSCFFCSSLCLSSFNFLTLSYLLLLFSLSLCSSQSSQHFIFGFGGCSKKKIKNVSSSLVSKFWSMMVHSGQAFGILSSWSSGPELKPCSQIFFFF